jgi:hypothetical protein
MVFAGYCHRWEITTHQPCPFCDRQVYAAALALLRFFPPQPKSLRYG